MENGSVCAVCLVCTLAFYVEHIASLRGSYQLFVFMVKELEDKKLNKQQLVHWLSESFIYPGGGEAYFQENGNFRASV